MRRPHIASAISDFQLVRSLGRIAHRDSAIVNLDLINGLEIVIRDHLAAAANEDLPHLHRRKPVDADVCDAAASKEQRDMRHILGHVGNVADAGRGNGRWLFIQDVKDDRDVMDGQVPDHVHVVLEESEARTVAVVVENIAEDVLGDQLLDFLHCRRVQKRVIYHQDQIAAFGFVDELANLLGCRRQRLFDEHMLTGA